MRWDSSRPVPWSRLAREWVIYAGIMFVISFFIFDPDQRPGMIVGVLISGPMYLLFGAALAKFGYQRKTIKQLRSESPSRAKTGSDDSNAGRASGNAGPRPRPAPTKRTSTGPNKPRKSKR